jgi:hypothetical protein
VYKFPHTIGATSSMIGGRNRPNETSYPNVCDLRCPYNSTMAFSGVGDKKLGGYQIPQMWWYQIITKEKHGSNMTKKIVAWMRPKNQKLNVKDHIATMPTRYGRKPIPRIGSWYFIAKQILYFYLMGCEIKPTHIDMWLYKNNSLGERDYELVLMWPRQVSPTGILSRHPCHDKLPL